MDETYEYRLLRAALETARLYRTGTMDEEGVSLNLHGIGEALGGDVPPEVRRAISAAEATFELLRFASSDRSPALSVLDDLETTILRSYPGLYPA